MVSLLVAGVRHASLESAARMTKAETSQRPEALVHSVIPPRTLGQSLDRTIRAVRTARTVSHRSSQLLRFGNSAGKTSSDNGTQMCPRRAGMMALAAKERRLAPARVIRSRAAAPACGKSANRKSIIAIDFSDSIEARMSAERRYRRRRMRRAGRVISTVAMHICDRADQVRPARRHDRSGCAAKELHVVIIEQSGGPGPGRSAATSDTPDHFCFGRVHYPTAEDEAGGMQGAGRRGRCARSGRAAWS